ncbi:HNH domain protein [Mycolicibacterium canariasense]|uniref:HNH domain protein n=1 Tax=Mycolicibacterium canariasense TaxID=228230 RepID=A0A117IC07_MYCCR|nr:hypothetical protein [Mycolicibacterium canariasense]MCV7210159.1 hypothetical protein [Mycolicibacterium canariasense]GAS98807.1 HNH domain protein [Mycolicibacterium canariasense]
MQTAQKYIDRFFAKTRLDQANSFDGSPCIIWAGATGTKNGNGRYWDGQRHWVASQFAYALQHGEIPAGMRVWKNCGTQLCVNHLHMELITEADVGRRATDRYVSPPTFRCCGREKTPENSYGGPGSYQRRCKHCCHKSQKQWRKKPGVQDRINAQQRARKKQADN